MNDEQIAQFNAKQRQAFDNVYDRFLVELPQDVCDRMERIVAAPDIQAEKRCWMSGRGREPLCPTFASTGPAISTPATCPAGCWNRSPSVTPEVERHQADIRDLDLPDACVDVVFMNGMYGNIADKSGALRNIMRMLRPGGRVVISHPEGRAFVEGLVRSEPFPITALPSQDEAHAFLGSHGLTVTQYTDEEKLFDRCCGQEQEVTPLFVRGERIPDAWSRRFSTCVGFFKVSACRGNMRRIREEPNVSTRK